VSSLGGALHTPLPIIVRNTIDVLQGTIRLTECPISYCSGFWAHNYKEIDMRSHVINAMRGLAVITIVLSSFIVILSLMWLLTGARVSYGVEGPDGSYGTACGSLLHSAELKWVLFGIIGLPAALIAGSTVLLRDCSRQMERMLGSWKHLLLVLFSPLLVAALSFFVSVAITVII